MSLCLPVCLSENLCLYDRQPDGRTYTYGRTNEQIRQLDTQKEYFSVSQPARWTDSQTKVRTDRRTDI